MTAFGEGGAAARRQLRFWLLGLVVFLLALYFLRAILLPFVAGMAIAYVLDPVCDRIERLGCSRTWATTIVSIGFVLVVAAILLLLLPLLQTQLVDLANRLPGYAAQLSRHLLPRLQALAARFGIASLSDLSSSAAGQASNLLGWVGKALLGLLTSGMALANLLSLLFITPVVAATTLASGAAYLAIWGRRVLHLEDLR